MLLQSGISISTPQSSSKSRISASQRGECVLTMFPSTFTVFRIVDVCSSVNVLLDQGSDVNHKIEWAWRK